MARDLECGGKILVLGNVVPAQTVAGNYSELTNLSFSDLQRIDSADFEALEANCVVSEPFNGNHDCIDVGEKLESLSFRGRYVVVAQNLPNPRILAAELAAACPSLSCEILSNFSMFAALAI